MKRVGEGVGRDWGWSYPRNNQKNNMCPKTFCQALYAPKYSKLKVLASSSGNSWDSFVPLLPGIQSPLLLRFYYKGSPELPEEEAIKVYSWYHIRSLIDSLPNKPIMKYH